MTLRLSSWVLIGLSALGLASCGGGGCENAGLAAGSLTTAICQQSQAAPSVKISGVAAAGERMSGTVQAIDSTGRSRSTAIQSDGSYSLEVDSLVAPLLLKSVSHSGAGQVTHYAIALASDLGGTVNISAYSDLLLAHVMGDFTQSVLTDTVTEEAWATNLPKQVSTIEQRRAALRSRWRPLMSSLGLGSGFDLFRSPYKLEATGFGASHFLVRAERDIAQKRFLLRNLANRQLIDEIALNQPIQSDPISDSKVALLSVQAAQQVQEMGSWLSRFEVLFANGLPTRASIAASGLFDATGFVRFEGQTLDEFLDELTSNRYLSGLKLTDWSVHEMNPGSTGMVNVVLAPQEGLSPWSFQFGMRKTNNAWVVSNGGCIYPVTILGSDSPISCRPIKKSAHLSGVASAASALLGRVTVIDKMGSKRIAATAADGSFSIDVSGTTAPYLIEASGWIGSRRAALYSVATGADLGGRIAVSPYTDIIVSSLVGREASQYFSDGLNAKPFISRLSFSQVSDTHRNLRLRLQPLLDRLKVTGTTNFFTMPMARDELGLAALSQLIQVTPDASGERFTLKNSVTQEAIDEIGLVAALQPTPISAQRLTSLSVAQAVDLWNVIESLRTFVDLFKSPVTTAQILASGVVDGSAFILSGAPLSRVSAVMAGPLDRIAGITIQEYVPQSKMRLAATLASPKTSDSKTFSLIFQQTDGKWRLTGDQQVAGVQILSEQAYVQHANTIEAGLMVRVDTTQWDLNPNRTSSLVRASVSGPGLAASISLEQALSEGGIGGFIQVPLLSDGGAYNVLLFDRQGNAVNGSGYTVFPSQGVQSWTSLSSSHFISIKAVSVDQLPATMSSLIPGKWVSVELIKPADLGLSEFEFVQRSGTNATLSTTKLTRINRPDGLAECFAFDANSERCIVMFELPAIEGGQGVYSLSISALGHSASGHRYITRRLLDLPRQ